MKIVKVEIDDTRIKELIARLLHEILVQSCDVVRERGGTEADFIDLSNFILLRTITVMLEVYLDSVDDTIKKLAEEVGVHGEGNNG